MFVLRIFPFIIINRMFDSISRIINKNFIMKRKLLMIMILLLVFVFQSVAQGDLLITPSRVIFEGNKQKESLNLVNTGQDTATYSISFLQYDMKEDGSFVTIEKPDSGQMFADPYLRIFPRKVTLAPGEPQVIMLQCRRKTDMPAGEYRSHLYFRSEKNTMPLGEKSSRDTTHLSVQLIPVFGLSIPVIIRSGSVNVISDLKDLKLETPKETAQTLKLTINRTGNISVYGDILVEFIPVQGKSFQIGAIKGIGVYTNIPKRNVLVKLNNTSGKPLTNGKIRVQYQSNGETKLVTYAEAELDIKK
jgi:hypothetical protein